MSKGSYPEVMTVDEVAAFLRLSVRSVRTMILSGRLPASRPTGLRQYRVLRSDVEALLEQSAHAVPTTELVS